MVIPVLLGANVLARLPEDSGCRRPRQSLCLRLLPKPEGTDKFSPSKSRGPALRRRRRASSPVLKNYTPLGGIMVRLKLAIYGDHSRFTVRTVFGRQFVF
jgi:hypothetical protein